MTKLSELIKHEQKKSKRPPVLIKAKRYTADDLRIKVMGYLVKHKQRFAGILKHLPLSWGGNLRGGGGWSGPWLKLLEIVAEVI